MAKETIHSAERGSSRPIPSEFLPAHFDKMRPLMPDDRTIKAAKNAYSILQKEYCRQFEAMADPRNGIIDIVADEEEPQTPAYLRIRDAVQTYLYGRQYYGRRRTADLNAELSKIQKSAVELRDALRFSPGTIRGQIGRRFRDRLRALEGQVGDEVPNDPLQKIDALLEQLAAAASAEQTVGSSGARPKAYIKDSVAALVDLWCQAGNRFDRRFDTVLGRSQLEFAGACPNFVWKLISAIDSEIEIEAVASALKAASKVQAKTSKN